MKKIKICGVSLCTLLAATSANAAGYTCEELIEYTSCSAGYYLGGASCPDGYTYKTGVCEQNEGGYIRLHYGISEANCIAPEDLVETYGGVYRGNICMSNESINIFEEEGELDPRYAANMYADALNTCVDCPAGSVCAGGTADKTPCPAGAYCDQEGLTSASGLCAKGTYSSGGATECTVCPGTGLTDKDGAVVVATTLNTGATSVSACVVGEEYYFTDAKGTYHYKSDCAVKAWKMDVATEEACIALGEQWYWDGICISDTRTTQYAPTTQEECEREINGAGAVWENGECVCPDEYWQFSSGEKYPLYCGV